MSEPERCTARNIWGFVCDEVLDPSTGECYYARDHEEED